MEYDLGKTRDYGEPMPTDSDGVYYPELYLCEMEEMPEFPKGDFTVQLVVCKSSERYDTEDGETEGVTLCVKKLITQDGADKFKDFDQALKEVTDKESD